MASLLTCCFFVRPVWTSTYLRLGVSDDKDDWRYDKITTRFVVEAMLAIWPFWYMERQNSVNHRLYPLYYVRLGDVITGQVMGNEYNGCRQAKHVIFV